MSYESTVESSSYACSSSSSSSQSSSSKEKNTFFDNDDWFLIDTITIQSLPIQVKPIQSNQSYVFDTEQLHASKVIKAFTVYHKKLQQGLVSGCTGHIDEEHQSMLSMLNQCFDSQNLSRDDYEFMVKTIENSYSCEKMRYSSTISNIQSQLKIAYIEILQSISNQSKNKAEKISNALKAFIILLANLQQYKLPIAQLAQKIGHILKDFNDCLMSFKPETVKSLVLNMLNSTSPQSLTKKEWLFLQNLLSAYLNLKNNSSGSHANNYSNRFSTLIDIIRMAHSNLSPQQDKLTQHEERLNHLLSRLASFSSTDHGQSEKLMSHIERLLSSVKESADQAYSAGIFLLAGKGYMKLGNYEQAVKYLSHAYFLYEQLLFSALPSFKNSMYDLHECPAYQSLSATNQVSLCANKLLEIAKAFYHIFYRIQEKKKNKTDKSTKTIIKTIFFCIRDCLMVYHDYSLNNISNYELVSNQSQLLRLLCSLLKTIENCNLSEYLYELFENDNMHTFNRLTAFRENSVDISNIFKDVIDHLVAQLVWNSEKLFKHFLSIMELSTTNRSFDDKLILINIFKKMCVTLVLPGKIDISSDKSKQYSLWLDNVVNNMLLNNSTPQKELESFDSRLNLSRYGRKFIFSQTNPVDQLRNETRVLYAKLQGLISQINAVNQISTQENNAIKWNVNLFTK